jgi:hypothetical protein
VEGVRDQGDSQGLGNQEELLCYILVAKGSHRKELMTILPFRWAGGPESRRKAYPRAVPGI